jgi:flagellar hook assembly protein FlgD
VIYSSLPQELGVTLEVYDISGRLVVQLLRGEKQTSGSHHIEWNGRDAQGNDVSSGIYIYRLTAGKSIISRKMVLLK